MYTFNNPSVHHSDRTKKYWFISSPRRKINGQSLHFHFRPAVLSPAVLTVSVTGRCRGTFSSWFPRQWTDGGTTFTPVRERVTLWNRQGGPPLTVSRSLPAAGPLTGISKHTWHEVTGTKAKGFYVIFYYRSECSVYSSQRFARHVTAVKVLIDEITRHEMGSFLINGSPPFGVCHFFCFYVWGLFKRNRFLFGLKGHVVLPLCQ
jgi:hypothetical protein